MHYDESFEKNIFSRHNLFAIKKLNINIDTKNRKSSSCIIRKLLNISIFSPKKGYQRRMYRVHLSCKYRVCFKSCILSRCKHIIICRFMLILRWFKKSSCSIFVISGPNYLINKIWYTTSWKDDWFTTF